MFVVHTYRAIVEANEKSMKDPTKHSKPCLELYILG